MARGDDLPPSGRLTGWMASSPTPTSSCSSFSSFCCSYIGLILGIVGLVTCKDPKAKQNATITTILSAVFAVLGTVGILR